MFQENSANELMIIKKNAYKIGYCIFVVVLNSLYMFCNKNKINNMKTKCYLRNWESVVVRRRLILSEMSR